VICLEARPVNIEGSGAVTIRDLVRNSLRMRPDRIIVGSAAGARRSTCCSDEHGHDGSITTGHANTPRICSAPGDDGPAQRGGDPDRAIREQIASAIDVIVHTGESPPGKGRSRRSPKSPA